MEKYDVFILGTGTAGQVVAKKCIKKDKKVGIIDVRGYGGTCSQRGCDPKKLLLAPTEAYEITRAMHGSGIANEPEIDWRATHNFMEEYRRGIPEKTVKGLEKRGIDCYCGRATFVDEHTLRFNDKTIEAKNIVIATGRVPRMLDVEGADLLKTSEDFFDLKEMPPSIAFIGAGYIAMEFAHMAARAGSEVNLIERGKSYLNNFEQDVVRYLDKTHERLGIDIITETDVQRIERLDGSVCISYKQDGKSCSLKVDEAFCSIGRKPALEGLFEKANFKLTLEGAAIKVNKYLQSVDYDHIYACGDVSSHSLPLTPLSGIEASRVADNILDKPEAIETPPVPSVVFTIPQVSSVGLTEENLKEKDFEYETYQADASEWFNNSRINGDAYAYKVMTEPDQGCILGAHLIGPTAGEMINLFSQAMSSGTTFSDLKKTIYTYPSWANDIKSF